MFKKKPPDDTTSRRVVDYLEASGPDNISGISEALGEHRLVTAGIMKVLEELGYVEYRHVGSANVYWVA